MLAYGDFLQSSALQRNVSILAILEEEITMYPYSRKYEPKVGERISLQRCFSPPTLKSLIHLN